MMKQEIERKIGELMDEFYAECREIADECEAEGYPSHGSNYELRAEALFARSYSEELDELFAQLEEL